MNKGWLMVISAILTLPCYALIKQLGQTLPIWTWYITIAGFIIGIPLIFLENWLHETKEEELSCTKSEEKAP